MLGLSCSTPALRCSMRILSCGMWHLVPRPGIEPWSPALGAWILTHWTTREVPDLVILKLSGSLHHFETIWKVMELLTWEKEQMSKTLHTILGSSKTPPQSVRL